jgi:hypothetical protein
MVLFCFLQLDRKTLFVAYRFLRAKTPEQRAAVDLDTHYSEVKRSPVLLRVLLFMYPDVQLVKKTVLFETDGNTMSMCSGCSW